jgi:hypothetical protein
MYRRIPAILLLVLSSVVLVPGALAHKGPPYAVLVDHHSGPFVLSVWADPDVGIGTFYVYVEPLPGQKLPKGISIEIFVQPEDRRLPEARHVAKQTWGLRADRLRYLGQVPFDAEGPWRVRVAAHGPAGDGELNTEVPVTPPGNGPVLDFILYLFPFVAVGGLFVVALLRRRRMFAQAQASGGTPR